jgi:peptidoglycan/xylan/chitin deacetylase (PgdA/CDA1 family)
MKKHIKLKGPVIYLLTMVLFDFISTQVIEAQDNWRCPMLGNLNGPVVIFKADDYFWNSVYGGESENWTKFFNIIKNENICTNINVVTGWNTSGERMIELHNERYTNSLNDDVSRFDFLNHSYDHTNMVLKDYSAQYLNIQTSQDFFHNTLGFDSHGFVAPFNSINQTTDSVINDYNKNNNDLIKIWMNYQFNIDHSGWNSINSIEYGPDYSHLLLSTNFLETFLPDGTNVLEKDLFIYAYNRGDYLQTPIIIFEVHPAGSGWNDQSAFDKLSDLIAFLKSKNALFVTPTYLYNKANNEHYCGDYYDSENVNAVTSLSTGTSSQCSHTMVHDAANVSFTASKEISLKPGFTAEYGSTFDASIVPKVSLKSQQVQKTKLIEEIESTEIKVNVYPNPNNGIFTVDFSNQRDKGALIVISDLYGHEVKRVNTASSKETIDLSNNPSGIYMVQILSNNRLKTTKIVKDH